MNLNFKYAILLMTFVMVVDASGAKFTTTKAIKTEQPSFIKRHWGKLLGGAAAVVALAGCGWLLLRDDKAKRAPKNDGKIPSSKKIECIVFSPLQQPAARTVLPLPPLVEALEQTENNIISLKPVKECISPMEGKLVRFRFNGDDNVDVYTHWQWYGRCYGPDSGPNKWIPCTLVNHKLNTNDVYKLNVPLLSTVPKAIRCVETWQRLSEVQPNNAINNETMCLFSEAVTRAGETHLIKNSLTVNFNAETKAATFDFMQTTFDVEQLNPEEIKQYKNDAIALSRKVSKFTRQLFIETFFGDVTA